MTRPSPNLTGLGPFVAAAALAGCSGLDFGGEPRMGNAAAADSKSVGVVAPGPDSSPGLRADSGEEPEEPNLSFAWTRMWSLEVFRSALGRRGMSGLRGAEPEAAVEADPAGEAGRCAVEEDGAGAGGGDDRA